MAEENSLDSQLWHACAGSMVQIPPVNSRVIYFPQGHLEHAQADLDLTSSPRIPPFIPCRIVDIKFLAEPETDEVYARLKLLPTVEDDGEIEDMVEIQDKPASFAKTLTQSDANNGGGFSVPRYCAETIFPRLDYSSDPPVQTVIAKDVHGEIWKFRHIYRGTPRRHLLTTGWSTFVNQKKLVAGDSIVFLRSENGELCVGIRRAKRATSGWNTGSGSYARGFSYAGSLGRGRVRAENVLEAASLAANGRPFEVHYYPRASTPEFFVKTEAVRSAMRVTWCSGMRFKMPFETEDSSRISWFMGTISSVHVADPVRWPHSPWRLLQVTWDEPDLLQNVKRVNPWLVELVSTGSVIQLPAFPPARKKLRFPPEKWLIPAMAGGPGSYCHNTDTPASIQGARHGISLPDLGFYHKLQSGLAPFPVNGSGFSDSDDNLSCFLTIGNSSSRTEQPDPRKLTPRFLLFGQPILTEQQLCRSGDSGGLSVQNIRPESLSERENNSLGLNQAHCKVFMESEDLGRSLDLSVLGSYEELHRSLANMFGLEKPEALSRVRYQDASGSIRNTGDEPYCDFMRTAKKLTIMMDSGSGNIDDAWIGGPWKAGNGLDSPRKRGPLSIFA